MRLRRVSSRGAAPAPGRENTSATYPHWPEIVSFGLVGLSLGMAAIAAVKLMTSGEGGFSSSANAQLLRPVAAPISTLTTKEDPLRPAAILALADTGKGNPPEDDFLRISPQRVARAHKEDLRQDNPLFAARIMTASLEQPRFSEPADSVPRSRPLLPGLAATPPIWKLERSWKLARNERMKLLAKRRQRLRERMCLAKAIYFEARSESIKGQMAVAKVILNRVRDPRFPSTICGVVYQGAERRNACQFSFACDGKPDYPTDARQWALAKRLAAKAMRGEIRLRGLEGVAFYHADYVRPTWASMMRPVIKIGRHIFYRDS